MTFWQVVVVVGIALIGWGVWELLMRAAYKRGWDAVAFRNAKFKPTGKPLEWDSENKKWVEIE